MRIIYYRSPSGNFGDDLNDLIWREVLPPASFDADDTVLLGIGSIFRDDFLSESATHGKRVFVLGSGAGTGPLPRLWPHPNWQILAVRGPLTARLIDRPGADITDAAALLAMTRRLHPKREGTGEIAFFPHFNSVEHSLWPEACKMAGFTFIDAHQPPHEVMRLLGRAHLVITEAMHGAIVADTLRIPWIPVVCSPAIVSFKWLDWTRSMELDYRPIQLPPSSGWEALKHAKIRMTGSREALAPEPPPGEAALIAAFHRRYGGRILADAMQPGPVLNGRLRSATHALAAPFDRIAVHRAAAALTRAANGRPYLSDDRVLANRVERLTEAVDALRRKLAA